MSNLEANSEAAQECLGRASEAMRDGDLERALKWFRKSNSLVPSAAIAQKIAEVEHLQRNMGGPKPAPKPRPTPAPAAPARSAAEPAVETRPFTEEQAALCKKINRTKDFYELLGVEKGCESGAITSAYRKLAVKLHPDKNSAPGATDAFKKVKTAYECLNDDQKRAHYDRFGIEEEERAQPPPGARGGFGGGGGGYHEAQEFTAEDLFAAFFGGGLPANGARRRRATQQHANPFQQQYQQQRHPQQQQQQPQNPFGQLLFLLPFLVILLVSVFNTQPAEEPFSMSRSNIYPYERQTQMHNVKYWVSPSFMRSYARDSNAIYDVDSRVEAGFIRSMKEKCADETKNKNRVISEARKARGADAADHLREANRASTPSCDAVKTFYSAAPRGT